MKRRKINVRISNEITTVINAALLTDIERLMAAISEGISILSDNTLSPLDRATNAKRHLTRALEHKKAGVTRAS